MENIVKTMVLIIWISISIFEITTYFLINPKPVYFRAWEAVSNYTGKDASVASFKPHFIYDGTMTGDLLIGMKFKALPSEIRKQLFVVDEYGYRNYPGFLNSTKIDAVVVGSSFVGGGQETQENLVSEILTNHWDIPTYNSTTSIQYFWEDERFVKNKPKYVIYLGSEGEVINSMWQYSIVDKGITKSPRAWNSYEEWSRENEEFPWAFDKFSARLKDYSLFRYYINNAHISLLNALFSRERIAQFTTHNVMTYNPDMKVIFYQQQYDIPLINTPGKTEADIQIAIKELINTKEKLKSKGITFIVAGMPSKTHLGLKKYRNISDDSRALYLFNKELKKAGIEYVDLLTPSLEITKELGRHLYFPDDSHWNSEANVLISRLLKEKINELNLAE
jgi:hypothetical protein